MSISQYICLFVAYSFLGWCYEMLFCVLKTGKWENRGFLYGPVCPIYGAGCMGLTLMIPILQGDNPDLQLWQVFIISIIGSAILEYLTSWVMEKIFHAVWWDYSDLPLNLNGRISLLTTLGFGGAGIITFYVIIPIMEHIVEEINPALVYIFSIVSFGIFVADFTLTVVALLHFNATATRIAGSIGKNIEGLVGNTTQKAMWIKHEIMIRQDAIMKQISLINGYGFGALKKISVFRDKDEKQRITKRTVFSLIMRKKQKDPNFSDEDRHINNTTDFQKKEEKIC